MGENTKRIIVLMPYDMKLEETLKNAAPEYKFTFGKRDTISEERLENANIIIGNPRFEHIKNSSNLEWLQLTLAGTDEYTREGEFPKHVALTNMTGAFGKSISEYMLSMIFSLYKKLHLYRDNQSQGIWKDMGKENSIYNKKVLIIGVGDIGSAFAKEMKKFDSYNIGIRRVVRESPDYIDEMHQLDELPNLLPQADIVAVCTPSTNETRNLFDKQMFGYMKEDAILINVGRGDVVNTDALYEALQENKILGAGIDVVNPEPLSKIHPLWKCENAIITPHITGAGYFHLDETYGKIVKICVENLKRFQQGKPLLNEVDLNTGYRKL